MVYHLFRKKIKFSYDRTKTLDLKRCRACYSSCSLFLLNWLLGFLGTHSAADKLIARVRGVPSRILEAILLNGESNTYRDTDNWKRKKFSNVNMFWTFKNPFTDNAALFYSEKRRELCHRIFRVIPWLICDFDTSQRRQNAPRLRLSSVICACMCVFDEIVSCSWEIPYVKHAADQSEIRNLIRLISSRDDRYR